MSLQHYRTTKFGECLVDSLDELVTSEKISPELAIKVLSEVRQGAFGSRAIRGPRQLADWTLVLLVLHV